MSMKKLFALLISLVFFAGITDVCLAADGGTVDNSTVSADHTPKKDEPTKKTVKKSKTKTSKKPKSKKKSKSKTKPKKKTDTVAPKPTGD